MSINEQVLGLFTAALDLGPPRAVRTTLAVAICWRQNTK